MLSSTCSTRSRRLPSCVWTCSAIAALLKEPAMRPDCLARTAAPGHLGCTTWTNGQVAPELHLRLCRLRLRRRLVARFRLACVVARLERMSAPAGGDGVGVADREAFAKGRFRVVDLRTAQVLETIGIHEDLHAAALEDLVVVAALVVEAHAVRKPFAPARMNEQPQIQTGLLLRRQQLLEFRGSLIRNGNHPGRTSRAILRVMQEQVKRRDPGAGRRDPRGSSPDGVLARPAGPWPSVFKEIASGLRSSP